MIPSRTRRGKDETWHLYPILARVELDTKERYKFFGLRSQRCCGIGSGPRRGRSLFRQCTPHATRCDIARKRELVASAGPGSSAATASLSRRGLHPTIQCTAILEDARDAVLNFPHRLYGGLYAYDTMHIIFIGAIGYLLEAIVDALTPSQRVRLNE